MPPDIFDDWLKDLEKETEKGKPLEFYEVQFKDRYGKWTHRPVEDIDDEWGPKLNLADGNERFSSFDEIPNFYEIAPYLKEFRIVSPIMGKIDLSIFKKIKKLILHVAGCTIEGLDGLLHLEWLDLSNTHFKKIDGLNRLKKLHKLNLSNTNIDKIPNLDELVNLKELNLSNNNISKIEGLDGLVNLEKLNLSHNQIAKIEGLDGLKNLKRLLMSHSQIAKIEGLEDLENVYELDLSHNQIGKIENLSIINNLAALSLSFNPISKIENLEYLMNLNSISLSNTQIKSLTGIESLQNLHSIHIDNTNVSSLEPLKKFIGIKYIRAKNCPIRSLHGITKDSELIELVITPENLCSTGTDLYKKLFHEYHYHLNQRILGRREGRIDNRNKFPPLLEIYLRSTTDLALQYINQSKSLPLTATEIERLIHEAAQKERMILEDAVSKRLLPTNDPILAQITARFSVKVKISKGKNKNLKILL